MRTLTATETVSAFLAGKYKKVNNTEAFPSSLYLFGNLIAQKEKDGSFKATLAGWNTNTTHDRIRELLRGTGHYLNREKGTVWHRTRDGKCVPLLDGRQWINPYRNITPLIPQHMGGTDWSIKKYIEAHYHDKFITIPPSWVNSENRFKIRIGPTPKAEMSAYITILYGVHLNGSIIVTRRAIETMGEDIITKTNRDRYALILDATPDKDGFTKLLIAVQGDDFELETRNAWMREGRILEYSTRYAAKKAFIQGITDIITRRAA